MKCTDFKKQVFQSLEAPSTAPLSEEMNRHLQTCPECRRYYEEIHATLKLLTPRCKVQASASLRNRLKEAAGKSTPVVPLSSASTGKRYLRIAATVAILLVGSLTASHFFFQGNEVQASTTTLSPEEAAGYFAKSIPQKPRSMSMTLKVRTLPGKNFAFIDPKADYVEHRITRLSEQGKNLWRIEKGKNRTVVCDGEKQYAWIAGYPKAYIGRENAGFTDGMNLLLYPDRIMKEEKEKTRKNAQNTYQMEKNDSIMRLTVTAPAYGNYHEGYLRNTSIADSDSKREYVFDRKSGLLRSYRVWIRIDQAYVNVAESGEIHYNVPVDRNLLLARPRQSIEWNDLTRKPEKGQWRRKTAEEAAEIIMKALTEGKVQEADEALSAYDAKLLTRVYGNAQVIEIGKSFRSGSYKGVFVPVKLKLADGTEGTINLAMYKENEKGGWLVDGGL